MSQLRAYAQLVRLPNVFTALADIALGVLVTNTALGDNGPELLWRPALFLFLASAFLYSAGMVWNDIFDMAQDQRERPHRPLPSRRITCRSATLLGSLLFVLGIGSAACADTFGPRDGHMSSILALVLVAAILLYDGWLKRIWAGPLGMGACRFLNVVLGLSLMDNASHQWGFYLASIVGVYIVGVTWFARTEALTSHRPGLLGAAALMLAAGLLVLPVPVWCSAGDGWPFSLGLLALGALAVGVPAAKALARPTPSLVQAAVKRAIMGLVLLDATLATAVAGPVGLSILLLLIPALYLGRWIYST